MSRLLARRRTPGIAVFLLLLASLAIGIFTYMTLTGLTPFTPTRPVIITMLVANLAVVLTLFALIAWRVARLIYDRRNATAGSKLHSRLTMLFAVVAVMPAILVAIFASVTLNRGLDTWFGERTRIIINNANNVAKAYLQEHQNILRSDIILMAGDLSQPGPVAVTNPARFQQMLATQAMLRSVHAAYLIGSDGKVQARATASIFPTFIPPTPEQFAEADKGGPVLFTIEEGNQICGLMKIGLYEDSYLYISRFIDARVIDHLEQTQAAVDEYEGLEGRRVSVQITFALIYVAVTLVILLTAIWLGLWVANRIVAPIGRLVRAAERIAQGDLSARVEVRPTDDEIDVLSRAFNRMTSEIEAQRNKLITANQQLDSRRQFTEAVLSGVSAGVLGITSQMLISHANRAAQQFFGRREEDLVGRPLSEIFPEALATLDEAKESDQQSARAQVALSMDRGERVLNLRIASEINGETVGGYVLTFDDITDLIQAQRNAAWADVARRIAHEIKNPLTPIQLSAERLRRKYSSEIHTDPEIFRQCTDTIIRQVGDIGRMVDEFSAFARMPAAVMKATDLAEVVKQAVFLQRVGHPEIAYEIRLPDTPVTLDGDSRLLSQALTNILKNAAEAIKSGQPDTPQEDAESAGAPAQIGRIATEIVAQPDQISVIVTDTGCGLPKADRARLTEPYMTTRAKGTGLGLAIVKKIMEDHGGTLTLEDAPRSDEWPTGARVSLKFPASAVHAGSPRGEDAVQEPNQSAVKAAM